MQWVAAQWVLEAFIDGKLQVNWRSVGVFQVAGGKWVILGEFKIYGVLGSPSWDYKPFGRMKYGPRRLLSIGRMKYGEDGSTCWYAKLICYVLFCSVQLFATCLDFVSLFLGA